MNYLNVFGRRLIIEAERKSEQEARSFTPTQIVEYAKELCSFGSRYKGPLYMNISYGKNFRLFTGEPHVRSDGHADWGLNRDIALV